MLALVAVLPAPAAQAGIADSPLPVLQMSVKTLHRYLVPGVTEAHE